MIDAIATWHAEHADYSRLLDVLEQQLAEFGAGRSPNCSLMRDVVSYLRLCPDRTHHPREDAAFACLVKRDPELEVRINRMLQEHRVVAAAGEELLKRLNDAIAGAPIERESLEAAAAVYLLYYRHHMAAEEREILPRAAKLLTHDDWRIVADAVSAAADPPLIEGCEDHYRQLRERIAIDAGTG